MVSDYVFHIRNAHPGDLAAVLAALEASAKTKTIAEIVECAEGLGYSVRDRARLEALITARDLQLVNEEENRLTESGRALSALELSKPDLFPELVHGLMYTLWDQERPSEHCFSWSYRTLCDSLWGRVEADVENRRDLAARLEASAREVFRRTDISLSAKSIGGALLWLSDLSPPVIGGSENRFSRRAFCPPELFLWATGYIYETESTDFGSNLLLSDSRRQAISQACLMDPTSFDRVLEYAVSQFDFLMKGVGGGWGHYITLLRPPKLSDFLTSEGITS